MATTLCLIFLSVSTTTPVTIDTIQKQNVTSALSQVETTPERPIDPDFEARGPESQWLPVSVALWASVYHQRGCPCVPWLENMAWPVIRKQQSNMDVTDRMWRRKELTEIKGDNLNIFCVDNISYNQYIKSYITSFSYNMKS